MYNTICVRIFVGLIFCECPVGEDFSIHFYTSLLCLKRLRTVCVTIVEITQQLEKYRLLLSDLSLLV